MFKNYLKTTWKVLLRRKFFTFISLFGIAFTLSVLMLVTSLLDQLFFPAEAGSRLDRALIASRIELKGDHSSSSSSSAGYWFLDKHMRSLRTAEMVSVHSVPIYLFHPLFSRQMSFGFKYTDANFWPITEMEFTEGGPYGQAQVDNADMVAVITDRTALQLYGKESALGRPVESGGDTYRVIGVVREPSSGLFTTAADIYLPVTTSRMDLHKEEYTGQFMAFILAPDRDDFDRIKMECQTALAQLTSPEPGKWNTISCPLCEQLDLFAMEWLGTDRHEDGRDMVLTAIAFLMFLFMLLPAINLMNINLSRIAERSSEIGVRKAFGATAMTLVGQFIVENVALTMLGGAIALGLTRIIISVFNHSGMIPFLQLNINFTVFLLSLGLCLFFGLASGVYPAFRMSRLQAVDALRGAES